MRPDPGGRGGAGRRPPPPRRGAARDPARWPSGWWPGGSPTPSRSTGCGRPSTRWPRTSATGPATLFGLPDGEHVEFELVTDQPWSGFNYYLGDLRSRVAVNTDLPVLSTGLAHLVAHEAYPGHHTEHTRKEVGLVRRRQWWEESIFLVGTPQCLLAEGLADLGLEVVMGRRPEAERGRAPAAARDPLRRRGGGGGGRGRRGPRRRPPERRLPPPRGRRRSRHGHRRGGPLGAAVAGPGGQGGRVPDPPDLAGLPDLLRGGPAPVPGLRGRRPGPVRPAALRAADPGRAGGPDPADGARASASGPAPTATP